MPTYAFRLLNVFTVGSDPLSGNPLCVFEDGRGLSTEQMQALALQFNLSETTFVLPSDKATAHVRIFTPTFEMPFAGHPTLGTAQVVRELNNTGDALTFDMKAGIVPVTAQGNMWTLRAGAPTSRKPDATREQLAQTLGLLPADIGERPLWVNTGSEQLIVPLTSVAAIERAQIDQALLAKHASLSGQRYLVHVWAPDGDDIRARFFFGRGRVVAEDPATGSACANLGGWFIETGAQLPIRVRVHQGEAIDRPSHLELHVDTDRNIYVGGRVVELGRGTIQL